MRTYRSNVQTGGHMHVDIRYLKTLLYSLVQNLKTVVTGDVIFIVPVVNVLFNWYFTGKQ